MIQTQTSVRVVEAIPQEWDVDHRDLLQTERWLIGLYVGKVGRVVNIDGCKAMPFTVRFSDSALPIRDMRFRAEEIGEA